MRFYEPADDQPCYYCKRISEVEDGAEYPVRDGDFTLEGYVFRCKWHSRFKCSICGEAYHFSWFYWCPEEKRLVCGTCNPPRMRPVKFWDWTYAYEFYCEECDSHHCDLLYAEFQGKHPWQKDKYSLESALSEDEPWNPLWKPSRTREGIETTVEDALNIENRVIALRREFGRFPPIGGVVPDAEIDSSDQMARWEENTERWIKSVCAEDLDKGDKNRQLVIDPALWELVGDVSDLDVLDAGCGSGYLTRELARRGAHVYGVDYSQPFIDFCKKAELEAPLGCKFQQASLTDLSMFSAQIFDLVVSNIVMTDIGDYKGAFKEIERVLKHDGRFVWSNTHPVFAHIGACDFSFPLDSVRKEERYVKFLDRYFDTGGSLIDWLTTPIWQFDRTFEEYSRGLKEAGFVISEIVEPRPTLEAIKEHPLFLAFDADRWTHFVIFECLKRPSHLK